MNGLSNRESCQNLLAGADRDINIVRLQDVEVATARAVPSRALNSAVRAGVQQATEFVYPVPVIGARRPHSRWVERSKSDGRVGPSKRRARLGKAQG